MALKVTNKSMRLLMFLCSEEPASLEEIGAFVYDRRDLAGVSSDAEFETALATEAKACKVAIKALQKLGWAIQLHTAGWTISKQHRKIMAAVEALYRYRERRVGKGSMTPANVAYWVVTNRRVNIAA